MRQKITKKVKIIIGLVIIIAILWFGLVNPQIVFHNNENKMESAARRYFELNSSQLPSGERIKTLPLQKLYDGGLLEKDFYIPLSKKTCSNTNSWVKVRRENGEFKYYTYLECGHLKSKIDHEGPKIILNGKEKIMINVDDDYKEAGVKSVKDAVDGDLKVSDVVIKGKVDTSTVGTYKVQYIAFDNLSNKTVVTRTINVVRILKDAVEYDLGDASNYKGDESYNYIQLSNMLFRIYGLDENKDVILVADGDMANVNYSKIDKWLDYYYDNLNDTTKKLIVKKKYCNMTVDESNLGATECNSYTDSRKVYLPSIVEVNKAEMKSVDPEEGDQNFMKPTTVSWVANTKNDKEAYITSGIFFGEDEGKIYIPCNKNDLYGIRPMFTIKGSALIKEGEGALGDPYKLGDTKPGKGGSLVSERNPGEYVIIDGVRFRIIKSLEDGTTKVISDAPLGAADGLETTANVHSNKIVYDPEDKESVAYFIKNKTSEYINKKYFVQHEIEVPVYKKQIIYGAEVDKKKFKVLFSAPDMFELFSGQSTAFDAGGSYWLCNYSKADRTGAVIENLGVPVNEQITRYEQYGIRVVGFLKKDTVVTDGEGTVLDPYKIK